MSNLFAKVGGVIASIGLAIGGFFGYVPEPEIAYVPEAVYVPQEEVYAPEEETLGADAVLPVAGVTYYLAGTGISSSATSFTLTSFTITQNGKEITDAEMSETFYFTLEPGSRTRQEIVACTTVVQNADDTATISGCSRGMAPVTPYTASTSLQFAHAGGSIAIISNPPQLYNQVAIKDNDETITGYWDFPTPVGGNNPTTKDYVLSVVTGGSISTTNTIVSGVAGETVATGTIVYLDRTLSRWYKADNDLQSTYVDQVLGIAQGPGTAGASISNGVLTYGLDSTQKSMTGGNFIFLSATAGATSTATTSQVLGKAISATTMFFDPNLIDSSVYAPTTFSATTTFSAPIIGGATRASTSIYTATTTDYSFTYTKPDGLVYVIFEAWSGGGGGSGYDTDGTSCCGGSGGGGGYAIETRLASSINSTTSITVGGYGDAGSSSVSPTIGGDGGTTTITGIFSITGGKGGGTPSYEYNGIGGVATGGDININGGGNSSQSSLSYNYSIGGSAYKATPPVKWGPNDNYYISGTGYGFGGPGGMDNSGTTAVSGAPGAVIITEYF